VGCCSGLLLLQLLLQLLQLLAALVLAAHVMAQSWLALSVKATAARTGSSTCVFL
jgi:hypothetical protein